MVNPKTNVPFWMHVALRTHYMFCKNLSLVLGVHYVFVCVWNGCTLQNYHFRNVHWFYAQEHNVHANSKKNQTQKSKKNKHPPPPHTHTHTHTHISAANVLCFTEYCFGQGGQTKSITEDKFLCKRLISFKMWVIP